VEFQSTEGILQMGYLICIAVDHAVLANYDSQKIAGEILKNGASKAEV
jgi:hypothetical protein